MTGSIPIARPQHHYPKAAGLIPNTRTSNGPVAPRAREVSGEAGLEGGLRSSQRRRVQ